MATRHVDQHYLNALNPDQLEWEREQAEHAGHHEHLIGTAVSCSCGKFRGVTTVDIGDPDTFDERQAAAVCRVCGQQGVFGPL